MKEIKTEVFEYYENLCSKKAIFQPDSIVENLKTRQKYASGYGKSLIQLQIEDIKQNNDAFVSNFAWHVAFDRLISLQYPSVIRDAIVEDIFNDIYRSNVDRTNFITARATVPILESLIRKHRIRKKTLTIEERDLPENTKYDELAEKVEKQLKQLRYHQNQDLCDTAICHFAVNGIFDNQDRHRKALCFTTDEVDVIRLRLAAFKSALKFVAEEAISKGFEKRMHFEHGEVHILSKDSGRLLETIDVKTLPDLLAQE